MIETKSRNLADQLNVLWRDIRKTSTFLIEWMCITIHAYLFIQEETQWKRKRDKIQKREALSKEEIIPRIFY